MLVKNPLLSCNQSLYSPIEIPAKFMFDASIWPFTIELVFSPALFSLMAFAVVRDPPLTVKGRATVAETGIVVWAIVRLNVFELSGWKTKVFVQLFLTYLIACGIPLNEGTVNLREV